MRYKGVEDKVNSAICRFQRSCREQRWRARLKIRATRLVTANNVIRNRQNQTLHTESLHSSKRRSYAVPPRADRTLILLHELCYLCRYLQLRLEVAVNRLEVDVLRGILLCYVLQGIEPGGVNGRANQCVCNV